MWQTLKSSSIPNPTAAQWTTLALAAISLSPLAELANQAAIKPREGPLKVRSDHTHCDHNTGLLAYEGHTTLLKMAQAQHAPVIHDTIKTQTTNSQGRDAEPITVTIQSKQE